jgi:metal-dependent hydrolase (beta-lactamase superfamily II)
MIIIDPDLFKQKEDEMKKARIKFQEEYEKKAKIALEKQKEVYKKNFSFGYIFS